MSKRYLQNMIADHYGEFTANSYDNLARNYFWSYDQVLEAIAVEVLFGRRSDANHSLEIKNILDLGMGTGNVTRCLLEKNDHYLRKYGQGFDPSRVRVLGVDASESMLASAALKMSEIDIQIETRLGRLQDLSSVLSDRNQFDCVVSSLAIHHLSELEKQSLFSEVLARLRPGGVFVVGDRMPPTDELESNDYMNVITSKMMNVFEGSENTPTMKKLAAEIEIQFEEDGDQPSSVEQHLDWLRLAGFVGPRNPFSSFGLAVVSGVKPLD